MPPPRLSSRDRRLSEALQDAPRDSPGEDILSIRELEAEIARASDPRIRDTLVEEHNRIRGQIPEWTGIERTEMKPHPESAPFLGPAGVPARWRKPAERGAFNESYPRDWAEFRQNVASNFPREDESFEEQLSKILGLGGPGALGILAGERGAVRLGGEVLRRFKEGEKALEGGVRGQRLWKDFGLAPGVEGKLRWEIPDEAMQIRQWPVPWADAPGASQRISRGTLQDLVSHPQLFAAYPELAQAQTLLHQLLPPNSPGAFRGLFLEGTPMNIRAAASEQPTLQRVLGHELQHGVQTVEDFARGSSMPMRGSVPPEAPSEQGMVDLLTQLGYRTPERRQYGRSAGEVEARNVEGRLIHPERRFFSPEWTEEIPREWQIINRGFGPVEDPLRGAR